jgi:predicted 3-demethylubiquinone-9 3-methyltransferase (glyoxalase superfamily)
MSDKNRQCHAFDTMMTIKKIDVATIKAARRG